MSDVIAVLDQLNREMVTLQHKHRRKAEEAYPGLPGEGEMEAEQYNDLMTACDHELDIVEGIERARTIVIKTRARIEAESTND